MKRHPALHKLSHDHHHGLVMALRLKKGGPASPNDNWPTEREKQVESLLAFAKNDLFRHFTIEEEQLLGLASNPALDARLTQDHADLRELLSRIEMASNADELLKEFGQKLEAHIRFEEREFFPHLQDVLGDDRLAELADRLR